VKQPSHLIAALCGSIAFAPLYAQPSRPILPLIPPSISTVPANGDANPYGVAVVPRSLLGTAVLQSGDILVSNFNNNDGVQGTGTTIVRINAQGQQSLFYQGKGLGFTGALGILANGIVVAGSLPTTDGTAATAGPGQLLFIDPRGNLLMTINGPGTIDGPWGLAIHDFGGGAAQIFVSNVLNGNIMRFDVIYDGGGNFVNVIRTATIASGFSHRPDPGAVVLGPSGLAYDPQHDTLFAASSSDNAIYAISGAASTNSSQGTGTMIYNDTTKLHGPVNMALAPNGHLIISNSDGGSSDRTMPSLLVEITTGGQFIGQYSIDASLGASFGIAVTQLAPGVVRVAAVDDNTNTLNLFTQLF
jgi:hypothetical protein